MIGINKYIRNILINNSDIISKVNNKIYSLFVPDESIEAPFIILNRLSNNRQYIKDEKTKDEIKFNVIVVDNDYSNAVNLAQIVDDLLDTYRIVNDSFTGTIRNINIREAYTGEYMIDLEYDIEIRYK